MWNHVSNNLLWTFVYPTIACIFQRYKCSWFSLIKHLYTANIYTYECNIAYCRKAAIPRKLNPRKLSNGHSVKVYTLEIYQLYGIASVVIPNPVFCLRAPVFYISDSGQLSQLYNVCGKVGGVQLHQSALITSKRIHAHSICSLGSHNPPVASVSCLIYTRVYNTYNNALSLHPIFIPTNGVNQLALTYCMYILEFAESLQHKHRASII